MIGKIRFKVVCASAIFMGLASSLSPGNLFSDVSFQRGNGNVYFAYKDTLQPEVERVYNSKAGDKDIFGWSWGTSYSTRPTVSADGSVVVHEFGTGAENRFN